MEQIVGTPKRPSSQEPNNSAGSREDLRQVVKMKPYTVPAFVAEHCVPPGLEYLALVDQIIVSQQLQIVELLVGMEQANKYVVRNNMGQFMYFALEESDFCTRCILGDIRPFEMKLMDYRGEEVMRMCRPLRCNSWICFCCLQEIRVEAPPGRSIGHIKQDCTVVYPSFSILNAVHQEVLKITGPLCTSSCMGDVPFEIYTSDRKQKIGRISKNWSGLVKEAFTNADNYALAFPIDLSTDIKAVLLGCLFLIEFIFFEAGRAPDLPTNIFN
ncbi:phospholipid scramblase 1-like [Ornithodoros turicata]|uniref:phospholipid scramblase 1-like n=1 Tax=Ornithodoros turicata TaxID=34597 RepID=UPI0031396035